MSSTTIKGVCKDQTVEDIDELRNAHGSAPVIWDLMSQKYLGLPPFSYSYSSDKLWPLWKDLSIPKQHRAVLAITYDNALVLKKDYKRAAEDIRQFLKDFDFNPEYINHLPKIAEIFEQDLEYDAIGFHWTSVSEDPFEGRWDDEKEEYGDIDWSVFWDVYKQLDKFN